MKLSFKKLLSLALVFSMMISALQVNVFAHNVEEKLEEAYSIAESLTFDETDAPGQEPLEDQGLSLEAEAVKEGEEKKLEDIPESEPIFEYPFRESDEMLLMEEIEATVNTTAGSVFRAAKEAVILFTVPEGIETVESLVITGGTAEYGTAEYSLTEINGRTFQTHIKNLEPETSYTVTPVFEEGYGNSYSFNTRAEITGIQASWSSSGSRIDLYGKNGEKTTFANNGWGFVNTNNSLTYTVIPHNTSENIAEIAVLVRNNTNAVSSESKFAFHADVQIISNDHAPIYNKNAGFLMTDGTYTLMLANKGSNIVNGKRFMADSYGRTMAQATTTKWWGRYSDRHNYYYTNGSHADLTGTDSGATFSWQGIVLEPGETRLYTCKFATGVSDEDDIIDWIEDVNNLTLTVKDPRENDVTDLCTVRWYEQGVEGVISTGKVLNSAVPDKVYEYEIILGDALGTSFVEPERQAVTVDVDTYDVSYTLSPLPAATISGAVKNENGEFVGGADIRISQLANDKYTKLTETVTSANGAFSAGIIAEGAAISISADGYYPRSFEISKAQLEEANGSLNIGTKILKELPETKIVLGLTKRTATVAGGTPFTSVVTSFSGYEFEIYDRTLGAVITDYAVQYPNIIIGDERVVPGHELEVTVTDTRNTVASGTARGVLNSEKAANITVALVENGRMICDRVIGNNSNVAMIFDAAGNFVERHILRNISLETSGLPAGRYSAVFIEKTTLLSNVAKLSKLAEMGLSENTDYIKVPFEITTGNITVLPAVTVPDMDESALYYTTNDTTSFMASEDEIVVGKMIVLRAEYEILPEYNTSAQKVSFELPEGLVFVDNSLTLNGTVNAYTKNGNEITVLTNSPMAVVRFYAMASDPATFEANAYLSFDMEGQNITQPIGTARFTTTAAKISVPARTGQKKITVTGTAAINSAVTVYDNMREVGTTTSNSNGNWSLQYVLEDDYGYSAHAIYADIETRFGISFTTETEVLIYDSSYIEIAKITMINTGDNGQNVSVYDPVNPGVVPSYRMWPGRYTLFTFIVEFTGGDNETISDVYAVTTNAAGENTYIPCTYDEVTGNFMGTHHFRTFAEAPVKLNAVFTTVYENAEERDGFNTEKFEDLAAEANETFETIEEGNAQIDALSSEIEDLLDSETPDRDRVDELLREMYALSGETLDVSELEDLGDELADMSDDDFDADMEAFFAELATLNGEEILDIELITEKYTDVEGIAGLDGNNYTLVNTTCDNISEEMLVAQGFEVFEGADGTKLYQKVDGTVLKTADFGNNIYTETSLAELSELLEVDLVTLFAVADNDVSMWVSLANSVQSLVETANNVLQDLAGGFLNDLERTKQIAERATQAALEAQNRLKWYESRWANPTYGKINSPTHLQYKEAARQAQEAAKKANTNYNTLKNTGIASKILKVAGYLAIVIDLINDLKALVDIYRSIPDPCEEDQELADNIKARIWALGGQIVAYAAANAIIIAAFNPATLLVALVGILAQLVIGEALSKLFSMQYNSIVKDRNRLACYTEDPEDPDGGGKLKPILDPSGYVYEAVPSNRISGVKAEAYYYDYALDEFGMPAEVKSEILWNAEEYDQVNPLYTDANGMYAWDVPVGEWLVKFSKDGYLDTDSRNDPAANAAGYLPVPPPQTEVNTAIVSAEAPVVSNVNVYNDAIQIIFSQYMKPASVSSAVRVTSGGRNISGTVTPANAEFNYEQTEQFASVFTFTPATELSGSATVKVSNAKNYAGTVMNGDYSATKPVVLRPSEISVPENVNVTYNSGALVEIAVLPAAAGAGKTVEISTSSPGIAAALNETVVTDENGIANVMLDGILPGQAEITFSLAGTDITAETSVIVGDVVVAENKCKKVTANVETNTVVEPGTRIILETLTEGADIYYTLDGTCPCDVDSASRIKYTQPIVVDEYTFIIAYAVKQGMEDSNTAGFVYTVPTAKPVATPAGGTYHSAVEVSLTTQTPDAEIYYTLDGTEPTAQSELYTQSITISTTCVLKAVAIKEGASASAVMTETYSVTMSAGDVNSDGELNRQDLLRLAKHLAGWDAEIDENCSDVNGDGTVSVKDLLRLAKYFAGWDVTLESPEGSGVLTRAEWINLLLDKVGAQVNPVDSTANYYGDTEGHLYEAEIEAAKTYGIIPAVEDEQDVPIFDPDEPATREFAAITAVLAMGYVCEEDDLVCSDKSELEYPKVAFVAVKAGFIGLEGGYFYPDRALDSAEKNRIFSTINTINESTNITEEIEDVTYASGVIVEPLRNILDYYIDDNGDGTYLVTLPDTAATRQITAGKYFVLSSNGIYISDVAFKATAVNAAGGYLMIDAVLPENVTKIISGVVFSGDATPIVDGIEVLDDNITYTYDPNGVVGDDMTLSGIGGSFAVPGKWTFEFGDGIKIGEHAKIKGSAEVTVPDITAYLDANLGLFSFDINEVTVSVTEKAEIKGEIEYTVAESMMTEFHSGSKEFARVPFALGATGLSIDLVFSLYYDVKGNLSIVYTVEATQGIQYKDDTFRFIHNFDSDIDVANLEFSGQIGLQAAINLVFCTIWDIVGVSGRVGAAATASVENHIDEDLQCIDGTIYLSAKASLNEETIIGSFLKEYKHYTLEKEFFTKENSPLRLNLHFENGEKVPECTYGKGHIEGYVFDAATREPIRYARISVYVGDDLKAVKYTDAEGKYTVESGLPVGEITIKISATGYQTYSDTRTISRNTVTYIESYLMVSRTEVSDGRVSGRFINALTGGNISGVTYEIRRGWNNISGNYIATSTVNGSYNVTLPAGNYTVYAKKDGFIPASVNVTIVANASAQADITMSPEDTGDLDTSVNLRFILTWGSTPSDLDSHLFGPGVNGAGMFHTYYSSKNYNYNGELIANLDLDDTSSYGPETTTIYKANSSGTYSYYVHDYTNRNSGTSKVMSNSGAKIEIYNGNNLYATFNVPTNVGGTVWHVFDYDPATGIITPVNRMTYSSDPGDLGLYEDEAENGAIPEQLAIEMINIAAEQGKEQ